MLKLLLNPLSTLPFVLALALAPPAFAEEEGDSSSEQDEQSSEDADGGEGQEPDTEPESTEPETAESGTPEPETAETGTPEPDSAETGTPEPETAETGDELPPWVEPEKKAAKANSKPPISDYIKTTLTFYIGDDNLLAGHEDGSPTLGMANEYPELFFEGLNAEKQKVVSESHLVLYGKMPGFLPFVDTEAAFVAEFELSRDPDDNALVGRFRDDGSWIATTFWFNRNKKGNNVRLTAWPYSADRFRLGYTYDLTWGGNTIWARNRGPVPGIKVHLDLQRFYAFVGAKALVRLRADNNETENYWGILGGLGPNLVAKGGRARLSYDLGGGYFSRGTFQQDPFRSQALYAFGLSHRLQFTWNTKMGISPDLKPLVNDPDRRQHASLIPDYKGAFGFGVGIELTTLWQSLIDADSPDSTNLDDAITGAFSAQARFLKNMRVGLDIVYRDVSFLVFNVPGLTPYLSFAEGTTQKPQVYGALWWDWYLEKAHLTPGFVFGLMQPASFFALDDAEGNRQLEVIREANDYEIMPTGSEPFTILSFKGSLKWHLSKMLVMVGEISYTQDYNTTKVTTDPETGVGTRVLDEKRARQLGLNLIIQAKF